MYAGKLGPCRCTYMVYARFSDVNRYLCAGSWGNSVDAVGNM